MALGPRADQLVTAAAKSTKAGTIHPWRAEGVFATVSAGEAIGLTPTLHGRQARVFQPNQATLLITEDCGEASDEFGAHITTRDA